MRNSVAVGAGVLLLVAIAGTAHRAYKNHQASLPALECRLEFESGSTSWLPVATNVHQMARGMSGRANPGQGMLFVWSDAQPRMFWMKNTEVPLSIAFLGESGTVTEILDMAPDSEEIHTSKLPAREAIELRQGDFARLGVGLGSEIINRDCRAILEP